MSLSYYNRLLPAIFLVALIIGNGCAAHGTKSTLLVDEARLAVAATQADPEVQKNAPLELDQAVIALAQAEEALQQTSTDIPEIEHRAYLAIRRASLAKETAALRMAEQDAAQAKDERCKLLLAASAMETRRALEQVSLQQATAEQARRQTEEQRRAAEQAVKEARTRSAETEQAHREAAEAVVKAERLEQQLAELRARRTNRGMVVTFDDVLFEPGKSELGTGAAAAIGQLAAFLNENPTRRVQLEGFTDNVGDSAYNLQLSIQRAKAVRDALSNAGIALERMLIEGYGKEFPVASNDTADGRGRNRRVEAVISDEQGAIPDRSH